MSTDEIILLALLAVCLLTILCRTDRSQSDIALRARALTWAAWQTIHPELFTPGSKGDRLDRTLFAGPTTSPDRQEGKHAN